MSLMTKKGTVLCRMAARLVTPLRPIGYISAIQQCQLPISMMCTRREEWVAKANQEWQTDVIRNFHKCREEPTKYRDEPKSKRDLPKCRKLAYKGRRTFPNRKCNRLEGDEDNESYSQGGIKKKFFNPTDSAEDFMEAGEDEENEIKIEMAELRDVVFGVQQEDDDNDDALYSGTNNDLFNRVVKQKPKTAAQELSKKVVAPYSNYMNHRYKWAEFRQRLVSKDL